MEKKIKQALPLGMKLAVVAVSAYILAYVGVVPSRSFISIKFFISDF